MANRFPSFNPGRLAMYLVLILYALVSIFPFLGMLGTSLMTLGEASGAAGMSFIDRIIPPSGLDFSTDISSCIVIATDTFFDPAAKQDITTTRLVIDIPDEVNEAQGYGFRSSDAGMANIQRQERLRIPFLSNYCAAWRGADLGKYMWNTVRIVAITIAGTLITCTLAAYAFARIEFVGRELIFAIMLSTLMIPDIVTNLPNLLILVGIDNVLKDSFICDGVERCIMGNWPALTIPFMAQAINIFLMRQHFATIPNELWEAARMDGAGHLRFLWQVVLPLSKPVVFVVILFTFINAWNELAWALLVTPGDDTWRPIAVGLQQFLSDEGPMAHLRMAGAVITIIPVLILYALTQRHFIEGLSQSGIK